MKVERWQAERISKEMFHCVNYLSRLQGRMVEVGFVRKDKLLQLVREAYDAMRCLSVELHYLSCQGGVGRPKQDGPPRGSASYH